MERNWVSEPLLVAWSRTACQSRRDISCGQKINFCCPAIAKKFSKTILWRLVSDHISTQVIVLGKVWKMSEWASSCAFNKVLLERNDLRKELVL